MGAGQNPSKQEGAESFSSQLTALYCPLLAEASSKSTDRRSRVCRSLVLGLQSPGEEQGFGDDRKQLDVIGHLLLSIHIHV